MSTYASILTRSHIIIIFICSFPILLFNCYTHKQIQIVFTSAENGLLFPYLFLYLGEILIFIMFKNTMYFNEYLPMYNTIPTNYNIDEIVTSAILFSFV